MKAKIFETLRLSEIQIAVLLEGVDYKLSRSTMGWSFDDGTRPLPIFHPATIRALWKKGLLDGNFSDPRGVGPSLEAREVQNLDGARYLHSPHIPELMVWTSALGRKVLEESGLLSDEETLIYH